MHEAFTFLEKKFPIAEHYNVDHFLNCMGLAVKTEYRERGIGLEMLKARIPYMNELGLKINATIFTGKASQNAAVKVGFEENCSIDFSELQEIFPNMDFSLADTDQCKAMSLVI